MAPATADPSGPAPTDPPGPHPGTQEAADRLVALVQQTLRCPAVYVRLQTPQGTVVAKSSLVPDEWEPPEAPDHDARTDRRFLIDDVSAREGAFPDGITVGDTEIQAFAHLPLWSTKGQRLGVLWVGSDAPRSWTAEEGRVLDNLAQGTLAETELRIEVQERLEVERTLRESEESFRLLVEGVRDHAIYMTDPDGLIVSWNRGAERIFGYTDQEVLFKSTKILHPENESARGRAGDELRRSASEDGQAEDEAWRVRKGGTPFWAKATVTALKDMRSRLVGYSVVVRDLTERKEAQEALHERDAVLEAVSFAADRFLKRVDWSEMLHQVLARLGTAAGASRVYIFQNHQGDDDTLLTSQRFEWCGPDVKTQQGNPALQKLDLASAGFKRWITVLGRGDVIHGEIKDFPPSERPVLTQLGVKSLAVVPIFEADGWWGFLGLEESRAERRWSNVVLDVLRTAADTLGNAIARRDAETALEQSEEGLRQKGKMEAVGRLAGGIAHDFNNLLTAIRGNVDLMLKDCADDDPRKEDLEEVLAGATRASDLTSQLLAFGRQQMLKPQVLDVGQVITGFTRLLRRMIGIEVPVEVELEDDLWKVRADRTQVEQVLMNLVINAKDALPEVGGHIDIRAFNAVIDKADPRRRNVMRPGRYLCLSVTDNGCGMSDDVKARVFEPFFTTKGVGKGTGLGLATAFGIVKQSGGYIWVDSAPGAGSTLTVFLPPVPEEAMSEEKEAKVAEAPAAETRGETILLVEDESVVRRLANRVLTRMGYTVVEAEDGPTALERFKEQGRVDLLVTDMVMPQMGGRQVAEAIATQQPDIRVVYMSGYTADEVFRQALPAARNRFLQKPFAPDELTTKVRDVLDDQSYESWDGASQ
ncbi:MAG: response regulator [Longimicrobiales bacterium]